MKKGVDYTGVAVAFFCHDGSGNYLVAKRSKNARDEHERWEPGGGGIEHSERAEDTVRREIKEEFNLDALEIEFLGYRDVLRVMNDVPTHWMLLDFRVLVDPTKVKIAEPHMIDEIRWVSPDAIPEPLHSQFPIFLQKYKDRFI